MTVNYVRTISKAIDLTQLQAEINSTVGIVASNVSISSTGTQYTFVFAAALSGPEEVNLDSIITAHVKKAELVSVASLPISPETNKLAVQSSAKPLQTQQTYAVWAGGGDDTVNHALGGGSLFDFNLAPGIAEQAIDAKFDTLHGKIWINEGYMKYESAGAGDHLSAHIISPASVLQTVANLDLVIVSNKIKHSSGGAGTGTHGFAATPVLVPRSFSLDGDWNYDGTSLTPNFAGTGAYQMFNIEKIIHTYINKIPLRGTINNYISLSSQDTALLPAPYF